RGEDLEVVAVQRRGSRTTRADRTAFFRRLSDQVAERTALLASRRRPVQAVLLAGIAVERHRVQSGRLAVVSVLRVALLRGGLGPAGVASRRLVAADPSPQSLSLSRRRVESPSVGVLHERYRKRPLLVSDDERLAAARVVDQLRPLRGRDDEDFAVLPGGCR